jgi:hypothetical protein
MPTNYISDSGDDKNDGLSLQTPIYSFKRAKEGLSFWMDSGVRSCG